MVGVLRKRGIDLKLRCPKSRFKWYGGKRDKCSVFNKRVAKRLLWTCAHVDFSPVWFITLTYHKNQRNGPEAKEHLHRFIKRLQAQYGRCQYLWIMEFQSRGSLHFHLWIGQDSAHSRDRTSGISKSPKLLLNSVAECELDSWASETWNQVTGQSSDTDALRYGASVERLLKPHTLVYYATKEIASRKLYQKLLPHGLSGAGRWWGKSRDVVVDGFQVAIPERCRKNLDAFITSHYGSYPGYGRVIFLFDNVLERFKQLIQQWGATNVLEAVP